MTRVAASFGGAAALIAVVVATAAAGSARAQRPVYETRFLSPRFGYSVVDGSLFIYRARRWSDATPPQLVGSRDEFLEDVAFADPQHGWVASYNPGTTAVSLYRTDNGGRAWRGLGVVASHSAGGGPTFLSLLDAERGWIEPVSPNAPIGTLRWTKDGGRTWMPLASFGKGGGPDTLPCLAPFEFVSGSVGWMARCGDQVFTTRDGGRRWTRVTIPVPLSPKRLFDLPRFFGSDGVVATTLGDMAGYGPTGVRVREVAFSVSTDGGRTWSTRSLRRVAPCRTQARSSFYVSSWPAGIVGPRTWWIVAGRNPTRVQVTTDAGRHWSTVVAYGLPGTTCAVTSVNAVDDRVAWVVVGPPGMGKGLFHTRDGGRTWRRVSFPA